MTSCVQTPAITLEEPYSIPPIYCSGLAAVRCIEDNFHFVLYIDKPNAIGNKPVQRAVNLRVIIPIDAVIEALPKVIAELNAAVAETDQTWDCLGSG